MPSSLLESSDQSDCECSVLMETLKVHQEPQAGRLSPQPYGDCRPRSRPHSPNPSPKHSPTSRRRRKISSASCRKLREKNDFFRKFSPLTRSSNALLTETDTKQLQSSNRPFIVDPTGKYAYYWLGAVSCAVVYYVWITILRVAFGGVQSWFLWTLLDACFYAIYVADLWVQMRTSYLHDGILQEDIVQTQGYYFSTWYFKADVLTVIPLDWLYLLLKRSTVPALLHCFKVLKIYRLQQFFDRTESRSHYPNTCRVMFLVHNLLVIIHWNACIYFLLSQWIGVGSDSWVYPAWNETHLMEWGHLTRQYIYSFYWSTLTLTTIGELPEPCTNLEYTFVTFDYLVGILMFATLVGNIGGIITNMQKSKTKFRSKRDQIKSYMKQTNVPNHLQERVIKWFDYLWTHGHPVDDQQALNALPDKLKAEIGIHVHFETLKKVDFFEECEQGLLWELVLRLRTQVYSPGDYVCRKGDVGREMYIVNNGRLEVTKEEDDIVLRVLTFGEYFGEISVLNLGKSQRRRTAFVRSVGYSSLLCLTQADLLDVLKEYPKTMEMLIQKGKKKLGLEQDYSDSEVQADRESSQTPVSLYDDSSSSLSDAGSIDLEQQERSSSEVTDELPPIQIRSLADQIIDVHIRLSSVESMIKELIQEMRRGQRKDGHLPVINERVRLRKISSQI